MSGTVRHRKPNSTGSGQRLPRASPRSSAPQSRCDWTRTASPVESVERDLPHFQNRLETQRPQRFLKLRNRPNDRALRAATALAGLSVGRDESLPKDVQGLHVDGNPYREVTGQAGRAPRHPPGKPVQHCCRQRQGGIGPDGLRPDPVIRRLGGAMPSFEVQQSACSNSRIARSQGGCQGKEQRQRRVRQSDETVMPIEGGRVAVLGIDHQGIRSNLGTGGPLERIG